MRTHPDVDSEPPDEVLGGCNKSVRALLRSWRTVGLIPLLNFNNLCSLLFRHLSWVQNWEQYSLLQLLGDLSTGQDPSRPDMMKCNKLFSWIHNPFPLQLVMMEIEKLKNGSLVLSRACPSSVIHRPSQSTDLHPITCRTDVHFSNSGRWSLITSVKTVPAKHASRSNKKLFAVDNNDEKDLDLVPSQHCAFPKCNT